MAILFPENPVDGDTYSYAGRTFRFTSPPGVWESFNDPNNPTSVDYIPEAPVDGTQYAREDASWTAFTGLSTSSSIGDLSDVDITTVAPTDGQVLQWVAADSEFAPTTIVTTEVNDLTASVTWANVPDVNITQTSVTQHEAALTITESQISDLTHYTDTDVDTHLNTGTAVSGEYLSWNGTDYDWIAAGGGGSVALDDLTDVDLTTTAPTTDQVLSYDGTNWIPADSSSGSAVIANPLELQVAAESSDANYTDVTALLSFDSDLTSTDQTPSTWTASGSAAVSATQSKFGGSSLDLTPVNAEITSADADTDVGAGDFTIEFWWRPTDIVSGLECIFSNGFPLQIYQDSANIEAYCSSSAASGVYFVSALNGPAASLTAGTWSHVAFVREGNDFTIYVDGVGGTPATSATAVAGPTADAVIGSFNNTSNWCDGYIDDFRFTKGVARYTADFTPPVAAFPSSGAEITIAEIEATGTTTDSTLTFKQYESGVLTSYTIADLGTSATRNFIDNTAAGPISLPTFTAATTGDWTMDQSDLLWDIYDFWRAFDANPTDENFFHSAASSAISAGTWVEITNDAGDPFTVASITSQSRASFTSRAGTGFKLQGSTDGVSFTDIETVNTGTTPAGGDPVTVTFDESLQTGSYTCYRFVVTELNGSAGADDYLEMESASLSLNTIATTGTKIAEIEATGTASDSQLALKAYSSGVLTTQVEANEDGVSMPNLPTSDPAIAGQLWNDAGTLKVSAG